MAAKRQRFENENSENDRNLTTTERIVTLLSEPSVVAALQDGKQIEAIKELLRGKIGSSSSSSRSNAKSSSGYSGSNKDFREGDWMCNFCGAHNFRDRFNCYKCRAPRQDTGASRPISKWATGCVPPATHTTSGTRTTASNAASKNIKAWGAWAVAWAWAWVAAWVGWATA